MSAIALATETAVSRAPQLSNTRLLNFFVERQSTDAKSQVPLFGAPGADQEVTLPTGPNRGSWNFNGLAYYVSGDTLYSVTKEKIVTAVGSGIDGTSLVGMSDNGMQLIIVNGARGWIYTTAAGLVQITSPAFYPARTVTFFDGYFILEREGTNEWFLSALYDGLTYNGLDFASAEAQPGEVVGTCQNLQLLFIFCTAHIELWYDAGTADFPFQRYAGGVINYGCVSPYTITKQDGAVFFLGSDKVFYRLQANVPIRVSTHPIEHVIEQDTNLEAAFCMTWTIEGHKMVSLTLPSSGITVCYDISTGKWHDRNSVDDRFNDLGAWRFTTCLVAYDAIYFGDGLSGQIGKLNWNTYTELGHPMMGLIASSNQHQDRKRVFVGRFELDVQAGVGLTTSQGSDPQIMLRRSIDGGETWSLQQPWRSMGLQGAYTQRLRWLRQGQGRQMMWQLVITDSVPRTIIQAYADLSVGL